MHLNVELGMRLPFDLAFSIWLCFWSRKYLNRAYAGVYTLLKELES